MFIKRALSYGKRKVHQIYKIYYLRWIKKTYANINLLENINDEVPYETTKEFEINIFNNNVDYKSINWHKDYKSGYAYPIKRFDKIRYIRLFNKGIEVKFPWELSRFQFGIDLALKYKNEKDEKYYLIFKSLVRKWIEQNPFLIGINWVCTMDVAIRAANWIVTANLFGDIFQRDKDFKEVISKSLIEHAYYIETFPEIGRNGKSNNHLISDYSGLYLIAISFKNHPQSKKWIEIAKNGLEQCMQDQVLEDGTNFENSIPYHRLILELFAIPLIINVNDFSSFYKARLYKMFEFVSAYIDQNGNAPQIGDNDSGFFLKLSNSEEQNHSYLLSLGNAIFRNDFGFSADTGYYPIFKTTNLYSNYNDICNCRKTIAFEKSGYYFLKNENMFVCIFCPTTSKGHRHFDTGSFTLTYKGKQIIVDPGTGNYTSDLKIRQTLRDYPSHNLYYINKVNNLNTKYFGVKVSTTAEVKEFSKDTLSYCVVLENGTKVNRNFKLLSDTLKINDTIEGETKDINTALHFYNKAEYKIEGVKQITEVDYLYSPSYSILEKKNKIVIEPSNELNIQILCK